jgi:hypothetical protein
MTTNIVEFAPALLRRSQQAARISRQASWHRHHDGIDGLAIGRQTAEVVHLVIPAVRAASDHG